jgi:hypothetical protein
MSMTGRFAPEAAVPPGSLFLRPDKKTKRGTRAFHCLLFKTVPQALQRSRLGMHSVRVELPIYGVMELAYTLPDRA